MKVRVLRFHAICFECGKFFRCQKGHYPTSCKNCRIEFVEPLQYTMPDFIVEGKEGIIVVYVDGNVHEKKRQHTKDLLQRKLLVELKYRIVVLKNNLIDNTEITWLRVIASGIKFMANRKWFYDLAVKDEKELPGIGLNVFQGDKKW